MFSYKFPIAIVTAIAFLQPPIVIAQDIAEVNNIARNISVKITGYGNGSGFILERQGNVYSVVTNKHVVPIDTEYEIQTYDSAKHRVISRQEIPDLDLAIIQFESTGEYQVAELGDSDELEQRQSISVAGFPGEQTDIDIIDGQIRSIRQEIIANPALKQGYALVYTNQTLPGSSGGAVLDGNGRVVAINGEASIDNKTGRDISRGIPINIFLAAKGKKPVITENNTVTATANNNNNSTTINTASESNYTNYQLAYDIPTNASIRSVAVSGNYCITGSLDKTIKVWNLATGELKQTFSGHSAAVTSVAIGGDKIVSSGGDSTIKVWSLATGELERTLTGHSAAVTSVAISGDKIVSGARNSTIKVWSLATGELEQTLIDRPNEFLQEMAVSGDKIVTLGGGIGKKIEVWNLATGKLEQTLTDGFFGVSSVAIGGDKIVGGGNSTIKVWNLATGELEQTLTSHLYAVTKVAISGDKIVSGGREGKIEVWNSATGELKRTLTGHSGVVTSVAISGDKIVSGSSDKTIKMWQGQK